MQLLQQASFLFASVWEELAETTKLLDMLGVWSVDCWQTGASFLVERNLDKKVNVVDHSVLIEKVGGVPWARVEECSTTQQAGDGVCWVESGHGDNYSINLK